MDQPANSVKKSHLSGKHAEYFCNSAQKEGRASLIGGVRT
jgi:hypothetical protein